MRNQHTMLLREGYPLIAGAALALLIMVVFRLPLWVTIPWLLVTVWVVSFFRNPQRAIAPGPDTIICPADGEVVAVLEVDDERFGLGKCRRVSVFMSPFNVHVNRVPLNGKVVDKTYRKGSFLMASAQKASLDNEQCALTIQTPNGKRYVVVQIAGMLARRIITYPEVDTELVRGQRYGLIRFGSRVDLYLPLEAQIDVMVGDKVQGAATAIGRLSDDA
jgi:phosphatidylserine decarboxylase